MYTSTHTFPFQLQSIQGLVAAAIESMADSSMAWNGHPNMNPEAVGVMLT